MGSPGTPLTSTQKLICVPQNHWKVNLKSFPMVYDMPILCNIGVSYTVGKLSESTFQRKCVNLRTPVALFMGVPGQIRSYHKWILLATSLIWGWHLAEVVRDTGNSEEKSEAPEEPPFTWQATDQLLLSQNPNFSVMKWHPQYYF